MRHDLCVVAFFSDIQIIQKKRLSGFDLSLRR